jgi:hypothetical protein
MMSAEMTRYTSTPHQRCLQMFQTLSARERWTGLGDGSADVF